MSEPFYKHHLFFCTNKRTDGRQSCEDYDATELRTYAKDKIRACGLTIPGGARSNSAGCLNRCGHGPVVVVYPEGVWYSYTNKTDIDEIVEQHLVKGEVVKRLLLG